MIPDEMVTKVSLGTSPRWNEVFRVIGSQLAKRSSLIAKRTLLIVFPGLLILGYFSFILRVGPVLFSEDFFFHLFVIGIVGAIIIVFFTIVFMSIFKMEQIIWLDSYFDGKNLTQKESWRIARKLFWQWTYLQFKLFYRYYLWVWISVLAFTTLWIYLFLYQWKQLSLGITISLSWITVVFLGLGLIVWFRYLKLRLSYAPFLFLDRYDKELMRKSHFWSDFFHELRDLHEVSKSEMFRKNVLLEIGSDTAMSLVEYITRRIQLGFEEAASLLPIVGGAVISSVGLMISRGIAEISNRIILFAKLTGRYVLYRFAFKSLRNKECEVNECVYVLKNQ